MKRSQLKEYIKQAIKKAMSGVPTHADEFDDSSSQGDIGVPVGDMGTHSGISALESYVKKAIKEYMNGSPWSHGIAVGHRINKYNDPELIKTRYDRAAANNFERRPKGRLSTPRGYTLDEGCNCGCGGCETPEPEHQSLRQYIQDYIAESGTSWQQNAYSEYEKAQEDLKTSEQEMRQAKQVWKADHTNDQLRYDYQDAIGKFKDAEKQVWMKQSMLPK